MNYQTLLTTIENETLVITINRPDKLNALNKTVIAELSSVVDEVYNNHAIKSAIITGSGPKSFVAGADISEFLQLDPSQGEDLARKGQQSVFDKIENSPKPIVAAVNGFALGGGCELALSCHFIIASDNAKFGQPEVNLGLIPGYGGTQRLVQVVGKGRAMQLLMTGEMISAEQAAQYGIANSIVKQEDLLNTVKAILQVIHTKAPLAIAKVIECVNNFDHTQQGYDFEIKKFGECFATEDLKEGASAFLEKRKPAFTGR
ncbi:enoyl-CoA hydratase/isomerase family protein [Pinibacter soli]|uniref:Enoyl-CoA hydratase-related protein n=1 Tax=Pinibacter soli TaxID=3044211 RepID=A0ABT6R765_9BACT|nr:enoyl-CoA hydratase-related protein [Pinibacter soli]MDI3318408.1 enoyl-CoA hydratase-related protein [Pinibacter soli]